MACLLIVDDERDIVNLITRFAEHEGCHADSAESGVEALRLCAERDYDLIILDIMMPGMDGYTVCRRIRQEKQTPVILLSAPGAGYDKEQSIELGVEDVVPKPISPKELMARVRAVLARALSASPHEEEEIVLQDLRIDPRTHRVFVEGEEQHLTAKEYEVLLFLYHNRTIVLSREQILVGVWGYRNAGDGRTVDWQIQHLRSKLGPCRKYIATVRGIGYRFDEHA